MGGEGGRGPGFLEVRGYCPMGCGETLAYGDGGHVTCTLYACPDPSAVDTILSDRETEHVVEIGDETFDVQHPLRERLYDELFRCELHDWLRGLPGPPARPGRYRATLTTGHPAWSFEPLPRRVDEHRRPR